MRCRSWLLCAGLLLAAAPAAAQQSPVGIFYGWGAFRSAQSCYAIAAAQREAKNTDVRPYAAVSFAPARRVRGQVYVRLRRPSRSGSAVLLSVDAATFQLAARGSDAWARDPKADAAIVQAMRTGLSMNVESRTARGGVVRDSYLLRGAATAIDAAALACLR